MRYTHWMLILLAAALLPACSSRNRTAAITPGPAEPSLAVRTDLQMVALPGDQPIDWEQLVATAAASDFVLIGERHDDAIGHRVQQALFADVVERAPGATLALEMLERDEQLLIDDYLDGLLDRDAFIARTGSASWGDWNAFYQPMIDTAKQAGRRVIGANAPRRYVRLARTKGYDHLRNMSAARRQHFDFPADIDRAYRNRFYDIMIRMRNNDPAGPDGLTDHPDEPGLDAMLRSQSMWDATMARSVADAHDGRGPVVLCVGGFHVEMNGGLTHQLRHRMPDARIMTIALEPDASGRLYEGDLRRADVVVYTSPE